MHSVFKIFLSPLGFVYYLITKVRNILFDLKLINVFEPPINSIGIGNLTVGGTGKTPTINYLLNHTADHKVAVLSRGYGRKTKGFIKIKPESLSTEVGDEPKMLFDINHEKADFYVCEKRAEGYQQIMIEEPETNLLLLDDVFQHRKIKPNKLVMLCDYTQPFYEDYILPIGRLREARTGARRANIILVTKCELEQIDSEINIIEHKIRKYCHFETSIYFSYFVQDSIKNLDNISLDLGESIVLISALANNSAFYDNLKVNYTIKKHYAFGDHHAIPATELMAILSDHMECKIVTTQKDFVKISEVIPTELLSKFYVSIQKMVVFNEAKFLKELNLKKA